MKYLGATLILLMAARAANGSNSMIASAWNQVKLGQYCGNVQADEVRQTGFNCSFKAQNALENMQGSAMDMIDSLVFQEAAELQGPKNRCLAERVQALRKSSQKQNLWNSFLVSAWLGKKKSELILTKCNNLFLSKVELANVKRYGFEKAFADVHEKEKLYHPERAASEETLQRWKPICLNKSKIDALKSADYLFQFSMPVVSSPALFKMMDNHRGLLVSKKTGKALTDDELLNSDLGDLSSLSFRITPEFKQQMDQTLGNIVQERTKVAGEIGDGKKINANNLTESQKDYLFEDGTVFEVLSREKLIDEKNSDKPFSNAAACILARYVPNPQAELFDLAATTVATGGVLGMSFKAFRYYQKLSALRTFGKGLSWGLMELTLEDVGQKIYKTCQPDTSRVSRKAQDMKDTNLSVTLQSADLPEEVSYERWNMDFNSEEAPSCNEATSNFILSSAGHTHCVREVIMQTLQLVSPIPIEPLLPASLQEKTN